MSHLVCAYHADQATIVLDCMDPLSSDSSSDAVTPDPADTTTQTSTPTPHLLFDLHNPIVIGRSIAGTLLVAFIVFLLINKLSKKKER